jgi:hypothetical protein
MTGLATSWVKEDALKRASEDFIEKLAEELGANFAKWQSFALDSSVRDAMVPEKEWAIVYTKNRDSGLLAESNADAIEKRMAPFLGWIGDGSDCDHARHSHWACGWIEGYYLRIKKDGKYTPAFLEWAEIAHELDGYPVLDEDDHSRRQCDASWDALEDAVKSVCRKLDVDEESVSIESVHDWLDLHDPRQLEDVGDHGACPETEAVEKAMRELGYVKEEDDLRGMGTRHLPRREGGSFAAPPAPVARKARRCRSDGRPAGIHPHGLGAHSWAQGRRSRRTSACVPLKAASVSRAGHTARDIMSLWRKHEKVRDRQGFGRGCPLRRACLKRRQRGGP